MRIKMFLLTILFGFSISQTVVADPISDQEVRSMIEGLRVASLEQDADAMVEFFHPDLIMAHPGQELQRGRDTIEAAMRTTVEQYSKNLTIEIVDLETYGDRGHLMVQSWHDIKDMKTGNRTFVPIRAFILVRRNDEGRWQIYRDFDHVPHQGFIDKFLVSE
ncbi:MAG: SgcJ/EcaC family oxidoreductase [Rhodospirillaceae bacterium]